VEENWGTAVNNHVSRIMAFVRIKENVDLVLEIALTESVATKEAFVQGRFVVLVANQNMGTVQGKIRVGLKTANDALENMRVIVAAIEETVEKVQIFVHTFYVIRSLVPVGMMISVVERNALENSKVNVVMQKENVSNVHQKKMISVVLNFLNLARENTRANAAEMMVNVGLAKIFATKGFATMFIPRWEVETVQRALHPVNASLILALSVIVAEDVLRITLVH
jgi:hypothetical protein